jgi:hypothetical protein
MNFQILVTVLVGALFINDVTSQPLPLGGVAAPVIPPVVPPVIPPLLPFGGLGLGLGLGLGFPGLLGLGGLGFGFPGLLGLGRFGLIGRRFLGKREATCECFSLSKQDFFLDLFL